VTKTREGIKIILFALPDYGISKRERHYKANAPTEMAPPLYDDQEGEEKQALPTALIRGGTAGPAEESVSKPRRGENTLSGKKHFNKKKEKKTSELLQREKGRRKWAAK